MVRLFMDAGQMLDGDLITEEQLRAYGLTPADVRDWCAGAVERVGLQGELCWLLDEIAPLLTSRQEGAQ
jgi:hypothetical protein